MGEIHDTHHAEDDAEADAHQAVGAADQQARRQGLQEVDQTPVKVVHHLVPWAPADLLSPVVAAKMRFKCKRKRRATDSAKVSWVAVESPSVA